VLFRGEANPGKTVSLSMMDNYNRLLRPANFEGTQNTNRDINTLTLRLNFQPAGRSLSGYLHYTDIVDVFEKDSQQFADRWQNSLGVRVNYKWLPMTLLYADVAEGISTGLGSSSTKVTSYPLLAVVGMQTALTANTAFIARVGYTQGFYVNGPDYATVTGGVQLTWRYDALGKISLLYNYDHEDSINANFYRDHLIKAVIEQQKAQFMLFASPELYFREYDGIMAPVVGPPTRDDTIFQLTAGIRYMWRDWAAASLYYVLSDDQTDYRYDVGGGMLDNPSYVRNEVMLGIRASY
jgi:hypothetical protein